MRTPVAIAAWVIGALVVSSAQAAEKPFEEMSFDAAIKKAGAEKKLVMVDFFTTWCGPCKMLDQNTWPDSGVQKLLSDKVVAVKLDAEKEVELAKKYEIDAYPTVLFVKPDGVVAGRLVGYRDPGAFTAAATDLFAGKSPSDKAAEEAAKNPGDFQARMNHGQTLAQDGKYKEALDEYLWCWEHGLENNPSFLGVRASFLLSYIEQLEAKYPPATKAMQGMRDKAEADLLSKPDDQNAAMDLKSLLDHVHDGHDPLATFDKLPKGSGGRKTLLEAVVPKLVEAKRYDVIATPEGLEAADRTLAMPRIGLRFVGGSKGQMTAAEYDETVKSLEEGAAPLASPYLTAFAAAGKTDLLRQLDDKVMEIAKGSTAREILAKELDGVGAKEEAARVRGPRRPQ